MAIFAANHIPVKGDYTGVATFPPAGAFSERFTKLDCFSNGTDVLCQFLEEEMGWQQDSSQEILLPMGFNSVPLETPFVAVRFRVDPQTLLAATGTINMRCLG